MATTRFYLDLRGRAKDGKGSIVITIYHNRTTAMIPTGIRVAPNEWDGNHIKGVPGSDALNARLAEKKSSVDRSIAYLSIDPDRSDRFDSMTAPQIKQAIAEKKVVKPVHLVSDMFTEYLVRDIKEGTKEIYRTTLSKVLAFGGKTLKMEDINLKWLHQFERFLARTQGVNGRAIYLRSLRAVCNYAKHTGAVSTYPFENFSIKHEPTKKRSVSIEIFRKFLNHPAPANLCRYRDYFLLMFYLIGINSKDLLLASEKRIVNGRLEYIREKTHKKYSIKIEPEAEELLKKYRGERYLLEAMDHCKHYKNFVHEMNDKLKEIGDVRWEMVPDPEDLFGTPRLLKTITPVIPEISTYYARHCWATFAYEVGISLDVISQALGHSSGNRTTLIYVKFNQEAVDVANRRVIDYLLSEDPNPPVPLSESSNSSTSSSSNSG
jgi:integrase